MRKKCFIVSCFGVCLLLSTVSPAAKAPATSSGGDILGLVEGVLHFCNKVNPNSASSYKAVDQLFTIGQSAKAIARVRNSDAYEGAYQQVTKELKALPASEALATRNAH
jgi:hypothetical protein